MFKSIAFAASVAAISFMATPSIAEDYPDITLRMAHPLPESWPAVQWDKWWAEEVARRSDGKIKIEIF